MGWREVRRELLDTAIRWLGDHRRRVLTWRLVCGAGVERVVLRRDGLEWHVAPGDDVGWGLFLHGGHQRAEIDALIEWARRRGLFCGERDLFVDVGANIGTTCIPFARSLRCRAVAIEPVSSTFERLQKNVASNGMEDSIRLVCSAVQNEPGRVQMALCGGASGANFVGSHAEYGAEDVAAAGLLDLVEEAGCLAEEVALVWADVQGSESAVIETGQPLWAAGVPLWAEVEPVSLRRQGTLSTFPELAARHFDRFIRSDHLLAEGPSARIFPIDELPELMERIEERWCTLDVLFLPVGFDSSGGGSSTG